MALIRKLDKIELEKDIKHSEVDSTFTIIKNQDGKFLQIDTYGSKKRQIRGKKSQSIRFSAEAIEQLKEIIEKYKF
ncbi:hypothetical protein [Desulforhopalus singaporensis]|uniref:Methionyl-tRNA formyltransferase n=1 Tax=Desulforhopalus singaporensis TaxID=91360 RepID=A0A1H0U577_9BACT|nr:hypothetical protein [Desulforhopalus singaporensis]SDP61343.1 hypothetical protein SAMN05660330_03383 [Desulforhopalus singaporensis]